MRIVSLRSKTNITFAVALLTLGVVGWFSIRGNRTLELDDQSVLHSRDVLETSQLLRTHIYDAASNRRAYTLRGDDANLTAFNQVRRAVFEDFDALNRLVSDNAEQQAKLAQIGPLIVSRLSLLDQSVQTHQQTADDTKKQQALDAQSSRISSQLTEALDFFDRAERQLLSQRSSAVRVSYQRKTSINVFLGGLLFVFLILTLAVLNRELSRREQAERSAAEQKELVESILDSCGDAVIVADASGKIILRNPVGVRYNAGAEAHELTEDYPRLLGLYRNDRETLLKTDELPLSRALRENTATEMEICVQPCDVREPRWVLAAGSPLLNRRGEKRGAVAFLRDITDRKRADEQLRLALKESESLSKESKELSEFADALQSCQTLDEAYKMSENAALHILGFRAGALCLLNPSRDLVESVANWNNCSTTENVFHPDHCWGLRRGKPYGGADSPLPCQHVHPSCGTNYLCVPLVAQGETLGLLYVENKSNFLALSIRDAESEQIALKRRANLLAERISLALANLKLRDLLRNQSIRDPLTGLYNRRYLEESLNRELHRANRTSRNLSLVMLDLDHFKHFNDTFGHQVGDILLKEVAAIIKSRLRGGDLACRYGGEEFSLIIAEVGAEGAGKCVESIRDAIKHLSLQNRGQTLGTVTISAGIATYPIHGDDAEALTRAADEALYRAKKTGRDRVVVYEPLKSDSGAVRTTT